MPLSSVNVKSTGSTGSVSILPAGQNLSGVLTRAKSLERAGCQAVLVSVDGVLVETRALRVAAWQQIAEELLFPFDASLGSALPELRPMDGLDRLLGPAARDIDPIEKELMLARQRQHYALLLETLTRSDVPVGVRGFAANVRAAGIKLAALAPETPELVSRLEVGEWFDAIFDGRAVDAAALTLAARAMGALPGRCVVITSCDATLRAARYAGMRTIGVMPQRSVGFLPDAVIAGIAGVRVQQLDALVDPAANAVDAPAA